MIYDSTKQDDLLKAKQELNFLVENECKFEIIKYNPKRNVKQNASLHLYFEFIAREFNELGLTQSVEVGGKIFEVRYNSKIVKKYLWKPLQIIIFDIESTTELKSFQINELIDTITKYFGDKGINIVFPYKIKK